MNSKFLGFGPPKTAAGRRAITMPASLARMMQEQLEKRAQPGPDGLVFVNTAGHSPHASSFSGHMWSQARARAGMRDLRWHDLRHTAVALAIEQGAHAKAIQERMGHSSVGVTLDRYGHLLPSIGERLADGLDATFRAAEDAPRPLAGVTEIHDTANHHRVTAGR
ncbi:MAG: site-specific integrase [Actinobacteria bacterium]|nr:site-specific integrase [Actinomycetota bacterium]